MHKRKTDIFKYFIAAVRNKIITDVLVDKDVVDQQGTSKKRAKVSNTTITDTLVILHIKSAKVTYRKGLTPNMGSTVKGSR